MPLAVLEVRRAKLRFGLLVVAIGLLVFLILFQQALSGRLVTAFVGGVRNLDADVIVMGAAARGNLEASKIEPGTAKAVRAISGVADAAEFAESTVTVTVGGRRQDATLWGHPLGGPGGPTTLVEGRAARADREAVVSAGNEEEGFRLGASVRVEPGDLPVSIVGVARDAGFSANPVLYVSSATHAAARRAANPDATVVLATGVAVRAAPGTSATALASTVGRAVDGMDGYTRDGAADASPGVSAVESSFAVILALFYVVVPLIAGLFFLILTLQKANTLTLLRALGAPRGVLVRNLLGQVIAVVVAGVGLATLLLWGVASSGGKLGIRVEATPVLATAAAILGLALVAAVAAIRRVLAIDPILATTGPEVVA